MGRFLCAIRVGSGFWNGSGLGVQTLMEQLRAEMQFRLRCYRTPKSDGGPANDSPQEEYDTLAEI